MCQTAAFDYFFVFAVSLICVGKRPARELDEVSVAADLSFFGFRTSRLLRTWPFAMMNTFLLMSGRFRICTGVCSDHCAQDINSITNVDKRRINSKETYPNMDIPANAHTRSSKAFARASSFRSPRISQPFCASAAFSIVSLTPPHNNRLRYCYSQLPPEMSASRASVVM